MKSNLKILMVLPFLLLCMACDDFEKNTFRTLTVMAGTYDGIMSYLGQAYKEGLISEEAKEKAIDVGNVFYGSYHTSQNLFAEYLDAKKKGNFDAQRSIQQRLENSMDFSLVALNNFITYYNNIASGVEGMKTWEEK